MTTPIANKPSPNSFSTLEEIENIITALVVDPECQCIMALSFFAGLRRGEIQALQWGDIDADFIHLRRNIVRGQVTTLKGKEKTRTIPLVDPLRLSLMSWRVKWPTNSDGWLFEKTVEYTTRVHIIPIVTKAGCIWRGLHAGRRGLGTTLRKLTGNSTAGQNILGHTDEDVTKNHYEKPIPEEALRGMKLLEDQAKSLRGKQ
jgi:integrase